MINSAGSYSSIVGSVPNAQGDRSLVRGSRAACHAPATLWHQRADTADGSQTPLFRKQARSRPAHLACQVISRSNAIRAAPLGRIGKRGFVDAGKVYDARSFALPSLLSRRKNENHEVPRSVAAPLPAREYPLPANRPSVLMINPLPNVHTLRLKKASDHSSGSAMLLFVVLGGPRCSFVLKNPWPGTLSGGERPDTRPSNNNHVQCLGPFTASAKTSQPIIFTDTDHQSCGRHDRMRAFNPDRGLGWRHSRCRRRHRVSGRRASPRVHASSP